MTLNLSVDELLTTTRSVRKRLDFEKPVPREVLLECLDLALQAPTGSNAQGWQWVFVDDPEKKKALADIYRTNATPYLDQPKPEYGDVRDEQTAPRRRLGEVPQRTPSRGAGHVDPVPGGPARTVRPRAGRVVLGVTAARGVELHAGAALPRARVGVDDAAPAGRRREAGRRILGIPFDKYSQGGLFPIAYTKGTDFRPAKRLPAEQVTHWNSW